MRVLCDQCASKPYRMPSATALEAPKPPAALDAIGAPDRLADLLDLKSIGITVVAADIYGAGSRASVEIRLSNGEVMTFDQLREMTQPGLLAAELVACTGATPKLSKPIALQATSLVRAIARTHRTMSDNDAAIEWGVGYLQHAEVLDFDLNDQADRWGAFSALAELDPTRDPAGVPPPCWVLRHSDGTRLVRSSWFVTHVKNQDSVSTRDIPVRMCRVGWERRGSEGRVKATRPGLKGQLNWAFFFVPAGWEDRAETAFPNTPVSSSGYEVTASRLVNARTQNPPLSRVETVTGRNPVTAVEVAA
jgi:hypothetical protein